MSEPARPAGVREAKKEQTRIRITQAGLRLFRERGYEGTTLEAIAEAAGISRRTFFYYFASKDEVLLAWEGAGALSAALGPAVRACSPDRAPLTVAQDCLIALASRYETEEARQMDALLQSSESLRAVKARTFEDMEHALTDALAALWPGEEDRPGLRITAVLAVGMLRLSLEDWRAARASTPLADVLQANFAALQHHGVA